jgi:hypothetical protein
LLTAGWRLLLAAAAASILGTAFDYIISSVGKQADEDDFAGAASSPTPQASPGSS